MIYIDESDRGITETVKAFLKTELSDDELQHFKQAFEKGANVQFRPMMHLKIIQASKKYQGKTLAELRRLENEAGNEDAFIAVDQNFIDKGAVWYVAGFADEDDVECGLAAEEGVLIRALVRTEYLAIAHTCWTDGNLTMDTELENLEEDIVPLRHDSEQSEPLGADDEGDESWSTDEIAVVAAPGKYEETTDKKIRKDMSPMPDKAVRLKPVIAQREHLISDWTSPEDAEGDQTRDGITFPAGSIRIAAKYRPSFPREQYKWPEGSL
ncbi:unnamed protein product [Zymoseptoria tritici ST99CH_1A5]|uniref:Uncharacterized protein n=1 Tax=Zymoseptoria tritici ST99CH_1A5 TaxID=1276529 RepID=A0A1Y6L6F8_ZYMTR|nr:unnamed protein product [Zymoseptoria tritici ST99CH_1A5]